LTKKSTKGSGLRAQGKHKPVLALASKKNSTPFARIEDAVAAVRAGKMIIIVDDADRENEGDLMIAAEKVTPDAINFMARYGRGLICLSMTPERLDELEIPLMVSQNSSRFDTAFRADGHRSGDAARRPAAAGAHVSATVPDRRRPRADGTNGSVGRYRQDCRAQPVRGDLRSHERRRHHGACA
jgi:hypothetical protein